MKTVICLLSILSVVAIRALPAHADPAENEAIEFTSDIDSFDVNAIESPEATEGETDAKLTPPPITNRPTQRINPCAVAAVTAAQQSQIIDLDAQAKKSKIPVSAQMRAAKSDLQKLIANVSATADMTRESNAAIIGAKAKLTAIQLELKTAILFNVLKAEQRLPYIACQKLKRQHYQMGLYRHPVMVPAQPVRPVSQPVRPINRPIMVQPRPRQ